MLVACFTVQRAPVLQIQFRQASGDFLKLQGKFILSEDDVAPEVPAPPACTRSAARNLLQLRHLPHQSWRVATVC